MKHHDLTVRDMPVDDLTPHPSNPNHGDVDSIADSIETNGLYAPIVVQQSTGHVLAGSHRLKAAQRLGITTLPAVILDVDDTEAKRILLADNGTAQKAVMDDFGIGRILQDIQNNGAELTGTGYDTEEAQDYLLMVEAVDYENARYADNEQPDEPVATGGYTPPKATPGIKVPGAGDPDYTPDRAEARPHPSNPARKLTVIDLPLEAHAWLTSRLNEITEENGLDTHTEAVLSAVADATGTEAPRLTAEDKRVSDPDTDGIPGTG